MSNFTLIGKKNGMMDIIRGNMNERIKTRKIKGTCVKGESAHNSDFAQLKMHAIFTTGKFLLHDMKRKIIYKKPIFH